MKSKLEPKDRTYKLLKNAPLSYTLPTRSTKRMALQYWDDEQKVNREIRYCTNQKSPFVDEQDGQFILEAVVFVDGFLTVPKQNIVLQHFLALHPYYGTDFAEVDHEKDAAKQVEDMDAETDARVAAKNMDVEKMEKLVRILFNRDPARMTTAEMKRDIRVYANNHPKDFLKAIDDPELDTASTIRKFFDAKLLALRANGNEVWFNLPSNKKKMITVPFGDDPYVASAAWLKSDAGEVQMKALEKALE